MTKKRIFLLFRILSTILCGCSSLELDTDLLPECTSYDNDYYYRSGMLYDTYDLGQIVELSNASENHCFSFKFTNGESYAQACENLFSDSSLSELMQNGGSINYINDDTSYTKYIVLYPN